MTKTILAVAIAAIYHNGTRYEVGDKLELTEAEFRQLSPLYVQPEDEALKAQQAAEREAESTAQMLAEQAEQERQAQAEALRNAVSEREQAIAERDSALAEVDALKAELNIHTARADRAEEELANLKKAAKSTKADKGKPQAPSDEQGQEA